jgi:hypothetical protein
LGTSTIRSDGLAILETREAASLELERTRFARPYVASHVAYPEYAAAAIMAAAMRIRGRRAIAHAATVRISADVAAV